MREHNTYAAKVVRKLDDNGKLLEEYPSATVAARENGLSYRYLMACIQRGKKCRNMRFEYCVRKFDMPIRAGGCFQAEHNPYEVYRDK